MLISLKVNNMLIFNEETEFSMQAQMRSRRFLCNVTEVAGEKLVKAAVIMGPNNSGKTNFTRILAMLRDILLNGHDARPQKNLFSPSNLCQLSVRFTVQDEAFAFAFTYDAQTAEYVSESFSTLKNGRETRLLQRGPDPDADQCQDEKLLQAMRMAGRRNLLIHLLDTRQFPLLATMRDSLTAFASSIEVIDMNNIPLAKTLELLKQPGPRQRQIAAFVRMADLALDDFLYVSDNHLHLLQTLPPSSDNSPAPRPQEEAINANANLSELGHLVSVYNGVGVQSILFDSTGTKKLAALASYILQALDEGRLLVVDELDNSLHFRLTRAVFSLFNNELNHTAQLIATAHDIALLDCRKLFRKEQIWFTAKDRKQAYLYSLADFTARKDGIRDTSDLQEKYRRGHLGALPEPDLFNALLELNHAKA